MKTEDSDILRRSSVFRFLSDEHFSAIEPLLQEEHYDFGDIIVKQDEPARDPSVDTETRRLIRRGGTGRGRYPKSNRALQHGGGRFAN